MITRDKDLILDRKILNECIAQFDLDASRLYRLYNYYKGQSDIISRGRTPGLPNNKLMHSYPQYIATITSGYLVGGPVAYSSKLTPDALDILMKAYDAADVGSIDTEIAIHQAIYGRGVELVYADGQSRPRTTSLNPQDAFVVYSDDAEGLPIFGVHRLTGMNEKGQKEVRKYTVYTSTEIIEYGVNGKMPGKEISRSNHNFNGCPMVEYWNNSERTGDFENVVSLIDAYNTLESDRVNDKEQFADALLVLTGVAGFDPGLEGDTRTPAQRLKQEGTLSLPDPQAKAEYLIKAMNEADTEILKDAIKSDIHKFSYVPDMSDENFARNSSGVAMKYKLFGLEQLTKIKERWFREGLRWRLRLFSGFLYKQGKPVVDPDEVEMQFRRSLPVNNLETAQMVQALSGLVPSRTLLGQISFVEDADEAYDELRSEKEEAVKAQAAAFGPIPGGAEDEEEEVDPEF